MRKRCGQCRFVCFSLIFPSFFHIRQQLRSTCVHLLYLAVRIWSSVCWQFKLWKGAHNNLPNTQKHKHTPATHTHTCALSLWMTYCSCTLSVCVCVCIQQSCNICSCLPLMLALKHIQTHVLFSMHANINTHTHTQTWHTCMLKHAQCFKSKRDATQMGTVCVISLKWIVINWKIKLLWRPQTHTETLMICAIQRVSWMYGTLLQDGCNQNPIQTPHHNLTDINILFFSHTSHFVLCFYLPCFFFEGGNIYS